MNSKLELFYVAVEICGEGASPLGDLRQLGESKRDMDKD